MVKENNCLREYLSAMPFTKKCIMFANTLKLKHGCWETEIHFFKTRWLSPFLPSTTLSEILGICSPLFSKFILNMLCIYFFFFFFFFYATLLFFFKLKDNCFTEFRGFLSYINKNQSCLLPPETPSPSHPSRLSQSPCLSSLSHTANSHWLLILHIVL